MMIGSVATRSERPRCAGRWPAPARRPLALFAADKLSKLRELRGETELDHDRRGTSRVARDLRTRRVRHYQRSLALLEERLPDSPLVGDLRDELRALLRERPSLLPAR